MIIFLLILSSTYFQCRRNAKEAKKQGVEWCDNLSRAISLSLIGYGITGLNVSLAYFELVFALVGIVVLIKYKLQNKESIMQLRSTIEKYLLSYRSPPGWIKGFGETKSLYIHIPKTAGTSISLCCYGEDPWHYPITHYKYLTSRYLNSLFKFTFVRNPYFRLLSAYQYSFKQAEKHPKTSVRFVTEYHSFEHFVKSWVKAENVNEHYFFWPQCRYICDKNNEVKVDYIGKFENIENDFNFVKNTLKISQLLPKANQSSGHDTQQYSDELANIVYQVYKDDFELFGYDRASYIRK